MTSASYMTGMTMNSSTFNEANVRRETSGRFGFKHQSAPESGLAPAPVIINSPAGGDRRANLWIVVPEGQVVEMNVFEAGIGRAEEETWREDTISFRRTEDGIRAVFTVTDEDINSIYAEAIADLDEATADEMRHTLRREVLARSFGNTDVMFDGDTVEFQNASTHETDGDGGFYTSNVFSTLESDPAYVLTRDGVLFPSAYSTFASYGYGD